MEKPAVLFDLGALIHEELTRELPEMAEALGRGEADVEPAVRAGAADYAQGKTTQGEYWGDIAFRLILDDLDVPAVFAERTAETDAELLGWIRAHSPLMVLGLISDATPDWVATWRKKLQLDDLLHVHIIDSDLDRHHGYPELLKLSAERLQRQPAQVTFVDDKPVHLAAARSLGMTVIDASAPDRRDYLAKLSV